LNTEETPVTVTWSDLVERTPERTAPANATTDQSTIDVVGFERHVIAEPDASGIMLVRDTLTERFTGGIEGEGTAEHIRWVRPDGSNTFVGIERIVGTVSGRRGSISLTCHGTTTDGVVSGVWHVLPGSGTADLTGLRGRGEFTGRQREDGHWQTVDTFTHWYEPEDDDVRA
jgi:hypothetical protein